jgi:nitroreductase
LLVAAAVVDVVTVRFGLHPAEALPDGVDHRDAFDLIRSRRSCRSFQSRDLTPTHRARVLDSVRRHTQPEGLIGERQIRLEYVAAPLTVWPVVGAHEFLVAVAPRRYDRVAIIDVGRSLQHVVLDATGLGVATCWIGPGTDHASAIGHLGDRFDPDRDHIVCVCAIGYRSRFAPIFVRVMHLILHRRRRLTSLFFADPQLTQPLALDSAPFAGFGRCYEACQWSPSSYNAQTTRCVGVAETVAGQQRPVRFDFYTTTTSRYYAAVALGIWCANWEFGCHALGIPGLFAVLNPEERGGTAGAEPPRYDVSWVLDPPSADPYRGVGTR